MPDDEGRLIQLAQGGSAAACAELYDRHYGAVYRYCYFRVGDKGAAQDLAGEVFVRMVAGLDRFQARGRPLLAWLYTVARNLVADHYRQRKRAAQVSLDNALALQPDGGDPGQAVDRTLTAQHVASALRHLTEEQRQVIVCKFVEDLDNAEIARLMGKSEGAIKALQHRALDALRRTLLKERWHERGV